MRSGLWNIKPSHARKHAAFTRDWYRVCDWAFIRAMVRDGQPYSGPHIPHTHTGRRQWTAAEDSQLKKLWASGKKLHEIARCLGGHPSSVQYRATKKLCLPSRYKRHKLRARRTVEVGAFQMGAAA